MDVYSSASVAADDQHQSVHKHIYVATYLYSQSHAYGGIRSGKVTNTHGTSISFTIMIPATSC